MIPDLKKTVSKKRTHIHARFGLNYSIALCLVFLSVHCPYNVEVSVETHGMVSNISAFKLSLSPILIDSNSSNSHVPSSNPPFDRKVAFSHFIYPAIQQMKLYVAISVITCSLTLCYFSLSHSDSFFFFFFYISTLALNFIVTRVTCFDSNQRSAFDLVFAKKREKYMCKWHAISINFRSSARIRQGKEREPWQRLTYVQTI